MNIGDGLTLQSQTVNGKTTSGIFFLPSNLSKTQSTIQKVSKTKSKFSHKPIDNKSQNSRLKATNDDKKNKRNFEVSKKIERKEDNSSQSTKNDVVFINNSSKVEDTKQVPVVKSKKISSESGEKKVSNRPSRNSVNTTNVRVRPVKQLSKSLSKELKVDTNFVTLTQDQLNTILNLVKTKQDIDLASVINKDEKQVIDIEKKVPSSEAKHVEPTSVPGLDLDRPPSISKDKNESDKENDSNENVEKLLQKVAGEPQSTKNEEIDTDSKSKDKGDAESKTDLDEKAKKKTLDIAELSGTLGGYGSRYREKSKLDERRKKWIEDLNEQVQRKKELQASRKHTSKLDIKSSSTEIIASPAELSRNVPTDKEHRSAPGSSAQQRTTEPDPSSASSNINLIHESLPTAIRSSFFLGEAAPREHAFSAKKKQEQQAWRNELQQQIKEKNAKKSEVAKERFVSDDAWSRHFDTMNPVPIKSNQNSTEVAVAPPTSPPSTRLSQENQTKSSPRNPALNSDNIAGIYSGEHTTYADTGKATSSHLRTMTSLLDPSQIEAMELKRRKQLEHRRIIAEQVEEKKRLKEQERVAKKKEEELEERRLLDERMQLKNQFEREKTKQQVMEEKRDRQTQELYQQMKEAEASALREKFEKRQKNLKNHGHDTSRLERTHQHVLEKSMHSLQHSPLPEQVPPLALNDDHQQHHHYTESPRTRVLGHSHSDHLPVTVVTSNSQVPIKLEISLNQKQTSSDQVAKAVQTDDGQFVKKRGRRNDTLLEILSDSDADTQYMDLPYPSGRRKDTKRKAKDTDREARNRNYDQYARTVVPEVDWGRQVKRGQGPKPKWGVGDKKKNYVPNSNRYVSRREKEERETRLRRREEQLLADQARNHPDRLVVTRNVKSDVDVADGGSLTAAENRRPKRKDRYRSPAPEVSLSPTKNRRNRSSSPPVPAVRNQMRNERSYDSARHRSETAISVTTENAKYESSKHSSSSPVPQSDDFVQYRRSDVVLDPNQPQSRPTTEKEDNTYVFERNYRDEMFSTPTNQQPQASRNKDPLFNADVMKQKDRQDKILKEISILRQGLLLKQREVASYPVAVTVPHHGKNLPERTNDVNMT